ncbi:MAG TPA: hypothetical protein VFO29_06115 [Candidatus Rubrimentiphilum sp.]|nr:hypothetical protein [Candidatus Rubrimentiphilum sp.]
MKRAVFALAIAAAALFAGLPANAEVPRFHFSISNEFGSNIDVLVTKGPVHYPWMVRKGETGKHSIIIAPGAALLEVTCRIKSSRHPLDLRSWEPNISVAVDDNCRLQVEYH